jgi:hypothetical protein
LKQKTSTNSQQDEEMNGIVTSIVAHPVRLHEDCTPVGRKLGGRTRITGVTGPAEFIDGWSIAMHRNRAESNEEVKL